MPELAEVEVVRLSLVPHLIGRKIESIAATGARSIRRYGSAREFAGLIEGSSVTELNRYGKYLLIGLDSGQVVVVHLRMSGRLRIQSPEQSLVAHTHVVWTLDDSTQLRFVDPRTFGEQFVVDDLESFVASIDLGPDPVNPDFGPYCAVALARAAKRRRVPVKSLLLDQRVVAGVGNIYADEICWRAGVRPTRHADTLSAKRLQSLFGWIPQVMESAIACGGSTLRDGQYVDSDGLAGTYQKYHGVHARAGLYCPGCQQSAKAPIKKVVVGGRSTYFCPTCQT